MGAHTSGVCAQRAHSGAQNCTREIRRKSADSSFATGGTRNALATGMDTAPRYQIDSKWTIVAANDEFCRVFRCAETGLIGRDVRDLLRADWRMDFRTYVARALVGVGDTDVTLPMVAPCGEHGWYKHSLEPLMQDGLLVGYRATVKPHIIQQAAPAPRWWQFRSPKTVWDFETEHEPAVAA